MSDQKPYVNFEDGLSRVRGNQTLYRRMLHLFLISEEFASLEEALDAADHAQAAEYAHAIKGMTGNLSLDALFTISTELLGELRKSAPREETIATYHTILQGTRERVIELMDEIDANLAKS